MKLEKGIVLFGAHIIGRAQELIHILNEVGIDPLVDERICRANEVYRQARGAPLLPAGGPLRGRPRRAGATSLP